jgi:hypothetical protein
VQFGGVGFLRIHYIDPTEAATRGLGACGEIDSTVHCWCLTDADGDCHPFWGTAAQASDTATANGWTVGEKDMPGDPCHNPACWCIVDPTDRTKCLQKGTMLYSIAASIAEALGTKAIPCPDESSSSVDTPVVDGGVGPGWLCVTGDSSSGGIRGGGQLVGGKGVICGIRNFGCPDVCLKKIVPEEVVLTFPAVTIPSGFVGYGISPPAGTFICPFGFMSGGVQISSPDSCGWNGAHVDGANSSLQPPAIWYWTGGAAIAYWEDASLVGGPSGPAIQIVASIDLRGSDPGSPWDGVWAGGDGFKSDFIQPVPTDCQALSGITLYHSSSPVFCDPTSTAGFSAL